MQSVGLRGGVLACLDSFLMDPRRLTLRSPYVETVSLLRQCPLVDVSFIGHRNGFARNAGLGTSYPPPGVSTAPTVNNSECPKRPNAARLFG